MKKYAKTNWNDFLLSLKRPIQSWYMKYNITRVWAQTDDQNKIQNSTKYASKANHGKNIRIGRPAPSSWICITRNYRGACFCLKSIYFSVNFMIFSPYRVVIYIFKLSSPCVFALLSGCEVENVPIFSCLVGNEIPLKKWQCKY